jgi:hypothetical protein
MTAPRDDEPRRVEAYLDALLTARDHLPGGLTPPAVAPRLPAIDDPRLAAAATALHASLVRFHPSFRFEDRLSARLRALAKGESWTPDDAAAHPATGRQEATLITFPGAAPAPGGTAESDNGRSLLLGGAIAGAAILAWRRQRGGRSRTGIA